MRRLYSGAGAARITSGSRQSTMMPRVVEMFEQCRALARVRRARAATAGSRDVRDRAASRCRARLDSRSRSSASKYAVSASDFARSASMPARRKIVQRHAQRRERENRRIRQLPAVRARHRREMRSHLEARGLIVAPPAGEARALGFRMAFVHEAAGDGARSGIEIFVAAPDREIATACRAAAAADCPPRARDRNRPRSPSRCAGFADRAQIERLAGAVLHAGQQHERDARAVLVEHALRSPRRKSCRRLRRFELDQRRRRIEAVEADLRFDRVAIRRKRVFSIRIAGRSAVGR